MANKGVELLFQDGYRMWVEPNSAPLLEPGRRGIFRVRGEGEYVIRIEDKSNAAQKPLDPWWADPGYNQPKPQQAERSVATGSDPAKPDARPRDPEEEKRSAILKEFGVYNPTRAERSAVRECDPNGARRTLGIGALTVRLEANCWTAWFAVPEAFEWSVADTFELELPDGRRLSRPTPGPPLWTAGGEFRLRGSREATVTVRRRQ